MLDEVQLRGVTSAIRLAVHNDRYDEMVILRPPGYPKVIHHSSSSDSSIRFGAPSTSLALGGNIPSLNDH